MLQAVHLKIRNLPLPSQAELAECKKIMGCYLTLSGVLTGIGLLESFLRQAVFLQTSISVWYFGDATVLLV